jgi:hypothetical protein
MVLMVVMLNRPMARLRIVFAAGGKAQDFRALRSRGRADEKVRSDSGPLRIDLIKKRF